MTSHELSIGDDAQSGDENVSTSATVPNSQDTSLNSPELPRSPVNESSIENLSTSDSQPLAMASKDRSSSTTSQPPPEVTQGLPIGDSAALPADKLEARLLFLLLSLLFLLCPTIPCLTLLLKPLASKCF